MLKLDGEIGNLDCLVHDHKLSVSLSYIFLTLVHFLCPSHGDCYIRIAVWGVLSVHGCGAPWELGPAWVAGMVG